MFFALERSRYLMTYRESRGNTVPKENIEMRSLMNPSCASQEKFDDQNKDATAEIGIKLISSVVLSIPKNHNYTLGTASFSSVALSDVEDTYEDSETGISYIQPYSGEILELCDTILSEGEYNGIGLSLKMRIQERLCDVVYLKKRKDQVTFESQTPSEEKPGRFAYFGEMLSPLRGCFFFGEDKRAVIQKRIGKQEQIAFRINDLFRKYYKEWKYEEFIVCDSKMLLQLEAFGDEAKKIHAVIFYYKEVSNSL